MDNLDHNPTSTTATSSFHGTSISLFQHPTAACEGEKRGQLSIRKTTVTKVPELPDSYTNIQPAAFKAKNPLPPKTEDHIKFPIDITLSLEPEFDWLESVRLTETVDDKVQLTWAAHHIAEQSRKPFDITLTSMLPLLRESAQSVATIQHVMNKVSDTVAYLNPGQIPVIAADQPIYALAKQIQWEWPMQYGEYKLVIIFGGLRIEMAVLKSLANLHQSSGWISALVEADITSPGTAESFLSASSVTRTRHAHQITACALYNLLHGAFDRYHEDSNDMSKTFRQWCETRKVESPQFRYWYLVLTMELTILSLVRAFREANFELYCKVLRALIHFFFANNNVNYARWLPIHLRDMLALENSNPALFREFEAGRFVVFKSKRPFSALAIDQAHEQANVIIKGDGGAVGITEDPSALRRWMVAGPEVSRLCIEFDGESVAKDVNGSASHHEQAKSAQTSFLEKVTRLTATINEIESASRDLKHKVLKYDFRLFSKLFMSCQSRECDLLDFFRHENQSFPAALSDGGNLHCCQKSQLATILQTSVDIPELAPDVSAVLIDGSAFVNANPPKTSKTFGEYAMLEVTPKVQRMSSAHERTDIVFDVYWDCSLKSETRTKRGQGSRRRVVGNDKLPPDWRNFLRDSDNKTDLFNFLAERIAESCTENIVIVTRDNTVVCNKDMPLVDIMPCNHLILDCSSMQDTLLPVVTSG